LGDAMPYRALVGIVFTAPPLDSPASGPIDAATAPQS
jgi:hypothetical protein